MKKKSWKLFSWAILAAFLIGSAFCPRTLADNGTADDRWDADSFVTTNLAATDALGRSLPVVSGFDSSKYVGVFYWLWHSGGLQSRDTTKLLRSNPKEFWDPYDETGIAPAGGMYYFNEPLYGYYSSKDTWVMRKHIEMFIAAEVDFLCFDYTNPGVVFEDALMNFLTVLDTYRQEGWKVPQIMFMTNTGSDEVASWLYNAIYKRNLYQELWFYGPYDKPLLVVGGDDLEGGKISQEVLDFFHIRPSQWPGFEYPYYEDGFSWCDLNRPPKLHEDMINVSVAQHHAYVFSYGMKVDPLVTPRGVNYGRGYTTAAGKNGDVQAILAGANIQEHWDYAISRNPEIVFVTGWNEWATNKRPASFEGQTVATFVDSFNTEFSRDMEMTKNPTYVVDKETGEYLMEGYGDNYYLQLIQNIRRYKGLTKKDGWREPVQQTIQVSGSAGQWNTVNSVYRNSSYDNTARTLLYKQAAADNFIRELRVTHDRESLYFYIETEEDITQHTDGATNWMNLWIGLDGSAAPAWETYQYVVNRHPSSGTVTSLEASKGGFDFEKVADLSYSVQGKVMQIAIPKSALGITGSKFSLHFKCSDSIEKEDDIMDYYVSGESVPIGRLSFSYYSNEAAWQDEQTKSDSTALPWVILGASIVIVGMICAVTAVCVNNKRKAS